MLYRCFNLLFRKARPDESGGEKSLVRSSSLIQCWQTPGDVADLQVSVVRGPSGLLPTGRNASL